MLCPVLAIFSKHEFRRFNVYNMNANPNNNISMSENIRQMLSNIKMLFFRLSFISCSAIVKRKYFFKVHKPTQFHTIHYHLVRHCTSVQNLLIYYCWDQFISCQRLFFFESYIFCSSWKHWNKGEQSYKMG